MESIGEKLRATREEKGLSVDQVARDTNIAKRYLLALEDEAFSEFPGEPYLIGFLRNYADYLDLDAEEIVGLYKNFKIQEQPVPMEELLEQKRATRGPLVVMAIVVIVALIVAAIVFLPPLLSKQSGQTVAPTVEKAAPSAGAVFQLKDEIIERRFVSGDTVVVPVGSKSYDVKLSVFGRDLVLTDANGRQTVRLGEEKSIDLNGDGTPDLKVFLRDVDTRDPAKGIIVRFDRFTQSPNTPRNAPSSIAPAAHAAAGTLTQQTAPAARTTPAARTASAGQRASTVQATPSERTTPSVSVTPSGQAASIPLPTPRTAASQAPAPAAQALPRAAVASAQPAPAAERVQAAAVPTITPQNRTAVAGPVVIADNSESVPFAVNVSFTGPCLLRYLIDGQSEDQRYFQKGETTRLDVKQEVEVWASNGGAMTVNVAGKSVDMGNPGEVVARRIAWVKKANGVGYQLQMTRLR